MAALGRPPGGSRPLQEIHSAGRRSGADRWRGDAANSWPLGSSLPPWARPRARVARGDALRHASRLGGALGRAAPGDVVRFCLRAWQRRQPSRVMCVG